MAHYEPAGVPTNPCSLTAHEMLDLLTTELQRVSNIITDIGEWGEAPAGFEELKRGHLQLLKRVAKERKRLLRKMTKVVERGYVLN
jgi:hypothetical protein